MQITRTDLFRQQAYIDGQWCNADSGQTKAVINPANGVTLGTIPVMGAGETRRAIEAAKKAQKAWAARTAKDRAAILRRWFDLMMKHQEDLARILTGEQGKPLQHHRASFGIVFGLSSSAVVVSVMPVMKASKVGVE